MKLTIQLIHCFESDQLESFRSAPSGTYRPHLTIYLVLFAANDLFRSALAAGPIMFARPQYTNLGICDVVS